MTTPDPRETVLTLLREKASSRVINLRDLGFVYRVSDEARAEIEAANARAARVLQTAHMYWFR